MNQLRAYKYGKAKVNVKGRGNLGFGWIEKKDLQSNKLTRTRYNQSYPYIAQVVATKEYIETDESRQLLNQQINTYRKKSLYNNRVHSNIFFGCNNLSSIRIRLIVFSAGEFVRL